MSGMKRSTVLKILPLALIASSLSTLGGRAANADDDREKFEDRAARSAEVFLDWVDAPESAPRDLLARATCLAVIPGVKRAGFIGAAMAGYGLASCRTATGWSYPSYLKLEGGSVGFVLGVQSSDVVLAFLNRDAAAQLGRDNFVLSGDFSVTAGPVGRDLRAGIDYELKSEVYSYSIKSRGIYFGLSLSGTSLRDDDEPNRLIYAGNAGLVPEPEVLLIRAADADLPTVLRPLLEALARVPAVANL